MSEKDKPTPAEIRRKAQEDRIAILRNSGFEDKVKAVASKVGSQSKEPTVRFTRGLGYVSMSLLAALGVGVGGLFLNNDGSSIQTLSPIEAGVGCGDVSGGSAIGLSFQLKKTEEGVLPERVSVFYVQNGVYGRPQIIYPREDGFYARVTGVDGGEISRNGPRPGGQISFRVARFKGEMKVYEGEVDEFQARSRKVIASAFADSEKCRLAAPNGNS